MELNACDAYATGLNVPSSCLCVRIASNPTGDASTITLFLLLVDNKPLCLLLLSILLTSQSSSVVSHSIKMVPLFL